MECYGLAIASKVLTYYCLMKDEFIVSGAKNLVVEKRKVEKELRIRGHHRN